MWNNFIRIVVLLSIITLSGCLTGGGNNQAANGFVISSNSATNVSDTTATLVGGFMNTGGGNVSVTFELGKTTAYGTAATPVVYSSAGYATVKQDFTGLAANTTYHYRLKMVGATATTYSADNTFTTLAALVASIPVVTGAANILAPNQIAADVTNVYWTELPSVSATGVAASGSIKMAAKSTGVATVLMPAPVAPAVNNPAGLAVDAAGSVYYANNDVTVTLNQVTVTGGVPAAPVVKATLLNPVRNVAVDANNVYVSVRGTWDGVSKDANDGLILQVPQGVMTGGTLCVPTITQGAAFNLATVAVVAPCGSGYKAGEVLEVTDTPVLPAVAVVYGALVVTGVDATGGITAVQILNSGAGVNAAAAATALKVSRTVGYAVGANLHGPDNLVSDGVNVYWSEYGNHEPGLATIKYAPVNPLTAGAATFTPGSEKTIVSGLSGVQYLAISSGYLYFSSGGGTISRVLISGLPSAAPVVVVSNMAGVQQPFAVDGVNIYWTELVKADVANGLLKKAPVGGGVNVIVAAGLKNPGAAVVDASSVYWIEKSTSNPAGASQYQDGRIMRHAK